ncbi:GPI anchored cell wall protein [Penicillium bovifimosum]|uniref:GPI anchored cell wall protein n=1 Tax=Penicillium bovifimosum TaxID=126998 RepID=A0A9W9KZM9_9EURO|nr:GPI anchored cell wall protein [Penicillium bovifimosum]KAJ5130293.1 GPI anchored cell wall protein [Penicillium bovifimosum]
MKSFIALAALAAGTNALVSRTDSCCFHLTSSGGASGKLGQLDDGQNRIGDNKLSPAQYCINPKGEITDANGRGCILTPPTTQFQCDEGSPSTPGFSISSKGELEHNGNKDFVACATGQNGGLNVYTHPNKKDVTGCVKVKLSADACSHSGSISGNGASSSAAAPSSSSVSSPSAAAGTGGVPAPSGATGSTLPGSPQTVVSTVTVTDCSCTASGAPGVPGAVGSSAPGAQTSVPSGEGATGGAKPLGSMPAPSGGVGIKPSTAAPAPSGGGGGGLMPSQSSSVSAPAAGGGLTTPTGGSASAPSTGSGVGTQPAGTASTSGPLVGGGGAVSTRSASASSVPVSSASVSSVPVSSTPVRSSTGANGASSQPIRSSSGSVPASSASPTPSATESASAACPTTLESGEYEIPHLIIPVDSSSPDAAPGTSMNGTVTSTISSVFNFDIPASDSGKTCSLVFLFPELKDLETSSYSLSGDGKIDFAKLTAVAQQSTSFKNVPSVSQDLGTISVSPGNSYVVSTFDCPAGEAVSYEMKNAGSTDLNFFQDWNPSPLGLFITTC